jgi:hypothetical protein
MLIRFSHRGWGTYWKKWGIPTARNTVNLKLLANSASWYTMIEYGFTLKDDKDA